MTRQSGAARKRLLAISIWALVWSLAGVDAAMASKRTGVTEWLWTRVSFVRAES